MSAMVQFEPGSYRDREGRVFYHSGAVLRALSPRALTEWNVVNGARFFQDAQRGGRIVRTERLPDIEIPESIRAEGWAGVLRHEVIPFVSYPYEWPFGMLQDAAILHLELLDAALDEEITLKDGTAYNVQWFGSQPVFIDTASFERLPPGEPWSGYRQFCQTMLFPLLIQAYKGVPFQPWLRGRLDGIEAPDCLRMMSFRDLFRRGVFSHVYLHARLHERYADRETSVKQSLLAVGFHKQLIKNNLAGLKRIIHGLRCKETASAWADYATQNTYADADRDRKQEFVRSVVRSRPWSLVWDLGCNTGVFSRIAAENADYVVAMDGDAAAVERLYQSLKSDGNRIILPLINDLADPSPDQGWQGQERKSFAARGHPELTLCLALLHHLVIGANIPLHEILDWFTRLGTNLIIEFVARDDPMVCRLLQNKRDNYVDYDQPAFERQLAERFDVRRREMLASGARTLYYAVARS